MNSRRRFLEVMQFGSPDRVPYFEEGIRDEVLEVWRQQGLPRGADIGGLFPSDRLEEMEPDLDPTPPIANWPASVSQLGELRKSLDPDDQSRLPEDLNDHVKAGKARDYTLFLRIHRGFFLSMGVRGWNRFSEVMEALVKEPQLVRESMSIRGEFAARLAERLLQRVEVDAVIFNEPIGGNDRPLISPRMYEEFVLSSYEPVLAAVRQYGVKTIIFRTYANARLLIPGILKRGFNCLWACEVNAAAMDYRDIRKEFGRDLRLIGGIDLDALRGGKEAIRREIEEKVPALLAGGGYVPLADGRVREDVSFENYTYYRRLLEALTQGAASRGNSA
ncbi:MAG: uroporphyrinogen decarboxylase family protein [Syntrophobacteraceae bacterium]|nr:uroporphyrinogen decarboxylase family protein [Syntrophobacteraceae bacterium]